MVFCMECRYIVTLPIVLLFILPYLLLDGSNNIDYENIFYSLSIHRFGLEELNDRVRNN